MERKFTEKQILDALERYYSESIFITDGDGVVIFANEVGAERLNSTKKDIVGKTVEALIDEGVYSKSTTREAIETKREVVSRITPESEDSTVSHSVPVLDKNGNVVMVVTNNMSIEHSRAWDKILTKEKENYEKLRRELDYVVQQDAAEIVASSPAMKRVLDNIKILKDSDVNVTIIGELGTGKNLFAREIHRSSLRKNGSFITINCASTPQHTLEAELFGDDSRIGLFEVASGGTLFIDEIGDMPMPLQAKVLRVLENKEIRRVGGVEKIPVDVRIICAVTSDLKDLVQKKKFREDLYYKLNVFTLTIPPLRERQEDILLLANTYLKQLNNKNGTSKRFAENTKEKLFAYSWPGNCRELKNVIERHYVIAPGNEIRLMGPSVEKIALVSPGSPFSFINEEDKPLKEYINDAEKAYIKHVIEQCHGSITKAAERLGVHRSVLYRKLGKY